MRYEHVICVDIDGVLGDYVDAMRQWCKAMYGEEGDLTYPDPVDYRMWILRGWPWADATAYYGDYQEAVENHLLLRENPLPHVAESLAKLRDHDWRIILSTRRRGVEAAADTVAWLYRHGIEHDGLHFGDKTDIEADYYVDDDPVTLQRMNEQGYRMLGLEHAYNRRIDTGRYPAIRMFDDWGKLTGHLLDETGNRR